MLCVRKNCHIPYVRKLCYWKIIVMDQIELLQADRILAVSEVRRLLLLLLNRPFQPIFYAVRLGSTVPRGAQLASTSNIVMADSVQNQQQEALRGTLLARLLDAVKQTQGNFGSKKEVAIDSDSRVSCLLAQLEAVFHHGLRRNISTLSTLVQMTEMVTRLSLDPFDSETALWSCIKCMLSDEEIHRFTRLKNITTDSGRGRAWLRAALNERSLERYLHALLANKALLEQFYEDWAFVRDSELSETLPQVAKGLSTILFALNIDNEELNSVRGIPTETSDLLCKDTFTFVYVTYFMDDPQAPKPMMSVSKQNSNNCNSRPKAGKKKRKPLVNVVSFETPSRISDIEGHMKVLPKKQHSADSNGSAINAVLESWNSSEMSDAGVGDDLVFAQPNVNEQSEKIEDISKQKSLAEELLLAGGGGSLNSSTSEEQHSSNFNSRICSESISSTDEVENTVLRTICLENGETFEPCFVPVDSGASVGDKDSVASSSKHSYEDSGSAMDDRETTDVLKAKLEFQMETIESLKGEISLLKSTNKESLTSLESKLDAVTKENEMLKAQVKGYVDALRLMKDGEGEKSNVESMGQSLTEADYEQKLVQVAQMHAELIEFNERLVQQLTRRKLQVNRLRNELIELRGPMPGDDIIFGDEGIVSADAGTSGGRPIVNIWIPSAFLTGKGTDVHHVYQVYIRVRESEWNLYRRYSDFLELHQYLKKQDPVAANFKFPPKKAMGKKEKKFVEERRKHLELYLRTVVNYVVQNFPEFQAVPVNKDTLGQQLAFFRRCKALSINYADM